MDEKLKPEVEELLRIVSPSLLKSIFLPMKIAELWKIKDEIEKRWPEDINREATQKAFWEKINKNKH